MEGAKAAEFLDTLVPTSVTKIPEGTGSLSVFTNRAGGIMDDTIINITAGRGIRVVSNAGCADKILAHLAAEVKVRLVESIGASGSGLLRVVFFPVGVWVFWWGFFLVFFLNHKKKKHQQINRAVPRRSLACRSTLLATRRLLRCRARLPRQPSSR